MNNLFWKCLALALAFATVGCGNPGPKLYKAGGTVTYKDKPVEGALLTFSYEDGNFASASTDAAGKFQLSYLGRPGGAALGKCKVTVSKQSGVAASVAAAAADDSKPKTQEEYIKKSKGMMGMKEMSENKTAAKDLIPKKYADSNTSGLAFEIKTDEKANDFNIVLTD